MKINHIGITVPDIQAAVEWYCETFDLTVLVAPHTASRETPNADRRRDVFGSRWGEMRLAHLTNGDGVGFELFEFVDPPVVEIDEGFDYWNVGISHIALTVGDIEDTIQRIVAGGGRARTEIHQVAAGVRICYCSDPWSTTIELVTGTYTQLVA
jgi:catechol 2,3-dioxygenase-like lactoylglutathione lyase family enzyme